MPQQGPAPLAPHPPERPVEQTQFGLTADPVRGAVGRRQSEAVLADQHEIQLQQPLVGPQPLQPGGGPFPSLPCSTPFDDHRPRVAVDPDSPGVTSMVTSSGWRRWGPRVLITLDLVDLVAVDELEAPASTD